MMRKTCQALTAAVAFALPSLASAAKFSWFDDVPARDSLGQVRTPAALFNRDAPLTFGIDAYKSLAADRRLAEYGTLGALSHDARTVVRFYGELSPRERDFRVPLAALNREVAVEESALGSGNSRLSGFGIKWQHRVDAVNTLSFAAGYSEIPWSGAMPNNLNNLDALDTRASVSWRGEWSGGLQPGLSGSLFVGDENVRDEAYRQLGRRYYGFSLGGELRVAQDHTPYLSYRLKRNLYSPEDAAYQATPYEDHSEISAGWRWQVQRNWSLQAEARYGLNGANVDPYSPDRSRFFFGTRFDFR